MTEESINKNVISRLIDLESDRNWLEILDEWIKELRIRRDDSRNNSVFNCSKKS